MRYLITLLASVVLISGCSFAKSFTEAEKSGPTITKTVVEKVDGKPIVTTTIISEGEKYKTADKGDRKSVV